MDTFVSRRSASVIMVQVRCPRMSIRHGFLKVELVFLPKYFFVISGLG